VYSLQWNDTLWEDALHNYDVIAGKLDEALIENVFCSLPITMIKPWRDQDLSAHWLNPVERSTNDFHRNF
jgi:hypothetical protein